MDRYARQVEAAELLAASADELLRMCKAVKRKYTGRNARGKTDRLLDDLFEKTQASLQLIAAAHEACTELLGPGGTNETDTN